MYLYIYQLITSLLSFLCLSSFLLDYLSLFLSHTLSLSLYLSHSIYPSISLSLSLYLSLSFFLSLSPLPLYLSIYSSIYQSLSQCLKIASLVLVVITPIYSLFQNITIQQSSYYFTHFLFYSDQRNISFEFLKQGHKYLGLEERSLRDKTMDVLPFWY